MNAWLLDLRYAIRNLGASPAFTATALVSLTLGIGANVVVLGVLNSVLLAPPAVHDPASLYQLRHQQWALGRLITTSYPAFEDFERRNHTFAALAAINAYSRVELRWGNTVRNVAGDDVSSDYFRVLRVEPQLGRFFDASEEHGANSMPFVVLSDALWRSTFGADRAIVGSTVEVNGHPMTVVGIAPAGFHGTERFTWPDYWIPLVEQPQLFGADSLHDRSHVSVTVIGRVQPGVTAAQATEDLNAIAAELGREYPATDDGQPLRLIHPGLIGDEGVVIRGFLYGVTALALGVLAAACANLASLFAARVTDRARELAIRLALGASRQRLAAQLLTEAFVLSLLGGGTGLLTAKLLLAALDQWPPAAEAHLQANVDARVFVESVALTLVSGLLFGIAPAWLGWRSSPMGTIKAGTGDGRSVRRLALRDWLLGVQIAICTLLVTASLVALRGMERALAVPLGFEPRGALLAEMDLGAIGGGAAASTRQAILQAIERIPGVTAAATINRTPFTGGLHGRPIFRPGTTEFKLDRAALAPYVFTISPGYLRAAQTRLVAGRDLSWHDTAKTPHVALVNQTFARKMWGEVSAIGQHFLLAGSLTEVVGITEDGKYHDLQETPQPVAYLPLAQSDDGDCIFVVRSERGPREMYGVLQSRLSGFAPNISMAVQAWTDSLDRELFAARAAKIALGILGLLAITLAISGVFGMAAYGVSRRRRELGIRVALGAQRGQLMRAALGRPLLVLGVGSAVGLLGGGVASRLLRQIVYGAEPRDPAVLGGVALVMALIGIVAVTLPARRALAVEAGELLRQE